MIEPFGIIVGSTVSGDGLSESERKARIAFTASVVAALFFSTIAMAAAGIVHVAWRRLLQGTRFAKPLLRALRVALAVGVVVAAYLSYANSRPEPEPPLVAVQGDESPLAKGRVRNDSLDSIWLTSLTTNRSCEGISFKFEFAGDVPDRPRACRVVHAALAVVRSGRSSFLGITPLSANSVEYARVIGTTSASILAGGDDYSKWRVLFVVSGVWKDIEVRFDRITHEVAVGFCDGCLYALDEATRVHPTNAR